MTSRMPPSGRRPMSWRPTPLPRLRMLRAGVKPSKSSSHPPCRASSWPHAPDSHRPTFSQWHGQQWETRQCQNSGHAATGRLFLVTVHEWLFAGYPDWTCPMHRFVSGYAGANRPIAAVEDTNSGPSSCNGNHGLFAFCRLVNWRPFPALLTMRTS